MAITVITAPDETNLVSLDDVKALLDITGTDKDALLGMYIAAVSQAVDSYLGRTLAKQTVKETLCGSGKNMLYVSVYPVTNITSVVINGETISDTKYEIFSAAAGKLKYEDGWPCGSCDDPKVEITYEGGYVLPAQLPAGISLAVSKAVAEQYRLKNVTSGVKVKEVPDVHRTEFFSESDKSAGKVSAGPASTGILTPELIATLAPYRDYKV